MERTFPADDISFDHLGTPVAVSDLSGQVVWTHRFSPFGRTIELNEDADGDGVKLTLNLRFPGQYYDAESGLHYNWHRYYDPETGRYGTFDKTIINHPMIEGPYEYCRNNPIEYFDTYGKSPQKSETLPDYCNENEEQKKIWDKYDNLMSKCCRWPIVWRFACPVALIALNQTCYSFLANTEANNGTGTKCYSYCMQRGNETISKCCKKVITCEP